MGWRTQLKSRFKNPEIIGSGSIEGSNGTFRMGNFYYAEYGTGIKGPKPIDNHLKGDKFVVFDGTTPSLKYYVPEPPFEGQDMG